MAKKGKAGPGGMPPIVVEARDEMNLAEFPLSLLTDRPDADRAALVYEDTAFDSGTNRVIARKLTITAPARHGLPRGADEDVIVALIQLTKIKNGFTSRRVRFARAELIELLGWPPNGKSYDRLSASLKRWTVASLEYDNAWWVKAERRWTSKVFHILDECEVNDGRSTGGERGEPLASEISWNETVFNSFASGNLKDLDYGLYLRLECATSRRMFRFLDKRLYRKAELILDLKDFALAHIGLSPGYAGNAGKIKEKLRPAIRELTEVDFLEPMGDERRFVKDGGGWKVVFRRRARPAAPEPPAPEPEPGPSPARALADRGVTPITAGELARDFPAEAVARKIEVFDWLAARRDPRVGRNPAGFLAKSIREDFAAPKGFRGRAEAEAERAAAAEAERAAEVERAAARAAEARRAAEDAAVDAHLAALSPAQRARLERAAFAGAGPGVRFFGGAILREHVRGLLARSAGE